MKDKLELFFNKYRENFSEEEMEYVYENMENFLNGGTHIDLLAQIAYAIGEKPQNGDLYEQYFSFLKNHYDLNGDILEVGCGMYPAFAAMIDEYQQKSNKGTIEVYDPLIITSKLGRIKINKSEFDSESDIKKFSLVTSIFPCRVSMDIVEKACKEDKDFSILMCECVPGQYNFQMMSSNYWQDFIYRSAKSRCRDTREVGIDYIDKVYTPIIYSKRKR